MLNRSVISSISGRQHSVANVALAALEFLEGLDMTKDARFWGRVDKGDSKSACWVWTGAKDGYGYGRVVRSQFSKKPIKAHRYAFYLHYGRCALIGFLLNCDRTTRP